MSGMKQQKQTKEKTKQPGFHLLGPELVANRVKEALATRDQGKEPFCDQIMNLAKIF